MKIGKKVFFITLFSMVLFSSCEVFKGGNNCDCPKFGNQPSPEAPQPEGWNA